jgi:hypothetical protein
VPAFRNEPHPLGHVHEPRTKRAHVNDEEH